jgi:hypothetical protein
MPEHRGTVTTWDILDSRRDWNMSKAIMMYYPTVAQFTTMLLRAHKGTCTSLKTYWPEDVDDSYRTLINNVAGYDANDQTLMVDSTLFAQAGDVILNERTMEHMLIDQDPDDDAHTIHVLRGYGETAAAAIQNDDPLLNLGNASHEASTSPNSRSTQPEELYNVVQHMRTSYEVSNDNIQEKKRYGKDERGRLGRKALRRHRMSIERVILWGERRYTANDRRTCGGLLTTFIKSNIYSAGGTLTENKFWEFSEMAFSSSSDDNETKTLVCSSRVITVLNKLFAGRITISPMIKKYGMRLYQLVTPHGTFNIIKSKALENTFAYEAISVDMDCVELQIFAGNDTKLYTDIKRENGYDGKKDEYRTKFTLKCTLEKKHARLTDVAA